MVVVMDPRASERDVEAVVGRLGDLGFRAHPIHGESRVVIGAIGEARGKGELGLECLPGVERVVPIPRPFKLASREAVGSRTVQVGNVTIGGRDLAIMAGPCAVENREQLLATARAVRKAGATILRGGAFKPRTSPYSFQGLGEEGLKIMAEAREETGLLIVTEAVDSVSLEVVAKYADIIQIGSRNMQNFGLLREAGRARKPVMLKRGLSATIEEWLMAAEYILSEGNYDVILCERGIRTYETYTRNTLDLSAVPLVKRLSHLPVIADPSHATGDRGLVPPMAKAAVMAGADGLMIEVHPDPARALSDGPQSLNPEQFGELMAELRVIARAAGRRLPARPPGARYGVPAKAG